MESFFRENHLALFYPLRTGMTRYACLSCGVSWFDTRTCWACDQETGITYDEYVVDWRSAEAKARADAARAHRHGIA